MVQVTHAAPYCQEEPGARVAQPTCSQETLDGWSQGFPRLQHRRGRAELPRWLRRGCRPGRAAAGGLGDARGQPPGDRDRRFRRPGHGDRQGRHRGARPRLHRGATFRRRAEGQDRRPPLPARAGDLQGRGRAAARQSRQGQGERGQHRPAIAARPGAGAQSEYPAIDARPARGRRCRGAGRGDAGAGAARPGADQSRLHRDPLAHRWADRACRLHRRQPGQPLVRDARDHRQPGPDLRDLSGERARRSRLQPQDRRVARQEPACDRSHPAAQRHHVSATRRDRVPRRPGRPHDRYRGGAGAAAQSGRYSDSRRHRRRERGARGAALGADRPAIRRPARSGRPLCPARRRREEGRAATDHHRGRPGSRHHRDRRPQGGRAGHRRGHPEGASGSGRDRDRRAGKLSRMFSGIFIDRPRLAFVIAIVITLAGLIAITAIPIAQFPDIVPPQVTRTANYPGADAEVVETTVAQPIEQQVTGIDNALYYQSASGSDGSYTLNVTFALGTDPDINTVNVQNRASLAVPQLPQEVSRTGLTIRKKSAALLQVITLYSPKNSYDAVYLSNYATINVIDALARIKGVGQVNLFGPLDYSLRIWLDPDRLTQLNLTPNDIIAAVQSQNIQAALGRVGAAPTSEEQQVQLTIKTKGRLVRPEEFEAMVVRAKPDGSVVRLKDVARIEMGAKSQDRHSRFNGAPAAALGIYQTPGSNAVDVARQVRDTMNTLATRFPNDLSYAVFFDTTVFVTATMEEVVRTLAEAIVLVALVVFLFLGRWRTTLIPLLAVPVSIIGTFAVMLMIGYSANTVSLLALVLAIGIVVDDAIVVVENVERVMEEEPELPVAEACKKAMAEITGPILAITLVLLSVFVPVAFIPGISGQLFRQFAVAVSVAMLISALNALTLSPALCAVLLKPGHTSRGPMRYVLHGIDRVRDGYVWVVRRLVRVAIVGVVVVAGVLAVSAWLFDRTPQSFLPEEDQGAIFAALRLPEGVSINRTEEVVKEVEDIVR